MVVMYLSEKQPGHRLGQFQMTFGTIEPSIQLGGILFEVEEGLFLGPTQCRPSVHRQQLV